MSKQFVAKEDWGEQQPREGIQARVTIKVHGGDPGIEGEMVVTAHWRRGHWIDDLDGQPLDRFYILSYTPLR
jgi:hypothetical protein